MSSVTTLASSEIHFANWRAPVAASPSFRFAPPPLKCFALKPDGVYLSNGPGDPASMNKEVEEVRQIAESGTPTFGICFGHQLLGRAFGGETFKLVFGHRGGNQPVKDLIEGGVEITSHNHGFAVEAGSLPPEVEVTHINLNDQCVEGLRHKTLPIISVQYHPEAAPGPHDAEHHFLRFIELMERTRALQRNWLFIRESVWKRGSDFSFTSWLQPDDTNRQLNRGTVSTV